MPGTKTGEGRAVLDLVKWLSEKKSVVMLDGGMGTMLAEAGWSLPLLPEEMNLVNPDAVRGIHEAYVEAGALVIETNTFGVMAMTQAVIPQMRERRSGTIVNVTSSATLASFPYAAAYTGSKTAIQGFTGSLAHELEPLGIGVKLVEPGYGPTTAFTANTDVALADVLPEPYGSHAAPILAGMAQPALFTTEADVAAAVWDAVHDRTGRSHFPAGADALAIAAGA